MTIEKLNRVVVVESVGLFERVVAVAVDIVVEYIADVIDVETGVAAVAVAALVTFVNAIGVGTVMIAAVAAVCIASLFVLRLLFLVPPVLHSKWHA